MIDPRHPRTGHLTESALMQWLDEPGEVAEAAVREHLAECATCRDQADALQRVFAELAVAASQRDAADLEAVLAVQRERIAGFVSGPSVADPPAPLPAAPVTPVTALRRPRRWIQLAAAASLAALVVFSTDRLVRDQTGGGESGDAAASRPELPIVTAAREAAEEAVTSAGADSAPVAAVLAELELAALDPGSPAALDDQLLIEDAFAALPPDDQAAILDELAMLTLNIPLDRPIDNP